MASLKSEESISFSNFSSYPSVNRIMPVIGVITSSIVELNVDSSPMLIIIL